MNTNKILLTLLATGFASALANAQTRTFLIDSGLDQLFEVSETGERSLIGSTATNGLANPADLTWRNLTEELWTIDAAGGELGTLDVAAGTFTPVHTTGMNGWTALAWHELDKRFYLCHTSGNLYSFVPATATLTMLGPTGYGALPSLDTDRFGKMLGISSVGNLLTIDRDAGTGFPGATTIPSCSAIALDPASGDFWAVDSLHDVLHEVDFPTGSLTTSLPLGSGLLEPRGMERIPVRRDLFCMTSYPYGAVDATLWAADLATLSEAKVGTRGFQARGLACIPETGEIVSNTFGSAVSSTFGSIGRDPTWSYSGGYPLEDVAWDPRMKSLLVITGEYPITHRLERWGRTGGVLSSVPASLLKRVTVDRYGNVFGLSYVSQSLWQIDPETGSWAELFDFELAGFSAGVTDIECDWQNDNFLVLGSGGQVWRLTPGTWSSSLLGRVHRPPGSDIWLTLAQPASAYVIDDATGELGSINLASGQVQSVGPAAGGGLQRAGGLAWWEERRELWTVDSNGGEVGILDRTTGRFQAMCETGLSNFQGIAWHPGEQCFFLSRELGDIFRLDPMTGVLTLVGPCGFDTPHGLEVGDDGTLFASDEATGTLLKIDLLTGTGAPIETTTAGIEGLGFEPGTEEVLAVRDADDSLYRLSFDEPTSSVVGWHGPDWTGVRGLQVIPDTNATVARTMSIGAPCGGLTVTTQSVPRVNSVWWLNASLQAQYPMVLALGYQDPQLSLDNYGAPGCEIRTQAVAVYWIGYSGNAGFLIPSSQSLVGVSLFVQAAASVPNANQLGAVYSNGLRGVIGW